MRKVQDLMRSRRYQDLMRSHRYAEAIADLRRDLASNPDDMLAISIMSKALRAEGKYGEALSFFKRLDDHTKQDEVRKVIAPGSEEAWGIDIACLHWLLDDHAEAIRLMHGLAAGILDGSIKYGDAAGGMSQGLLLYYMAITDKIGEEASFALDYMRNRVRRPGLAWPKVLGQYHLEEVPFEIVMERVNRRVVSTVSDTATLELGRRGRLSVALFHDGVRSRVQGNEEHCLARMQECCALDTPYILQEPYLARYEVQKARQ